MGGKDALHYWEIWYPRAAATGILIARGQIDPTHHILFHSAPDVITVEVSDSQGKRIAWGESLKQTCDSPMCRLTIQADRITREDVWPAQQDFGVVVLLPGGEAGILQDWWNAEDHSEWRWRVEFYNARQ